jgi:hypothetical protein
MKYGRLSKEASHAQEKASQAGRDNCIWQNYQPPGLVSEDCSSLLWLLPVLTTKSSC